MITVGSSRGVMTSFFAVFVLVPVAFTFISVAVTFLFLVTACAFI